MLISCPSSQSCNEGIPVTKFIASHPPNGPWPTTVIGPNPKWPQLARPSPSFSPTNQPFSISNCCYILPSPPILAVDSLSSPPLRWLHIISAKSPLQTPLSHQLEVSTASTESLSAGSRAYLAQLSITSRPLRSSSILLHQRPILRCVSICILLLTRG